MRLLICAGGTGGGVYPALAVLEALGKDAHPVLWVGGQGGMEADLVQRASIPFRAIPAAGVHGVGLRALPGNLMRLTHGVFAARKELSEFKPDVLLYTGGYIAAPMAIAAGRAPTLLFVPDIQPGYALKFLSHYATCIAVTAEESRHYFPHKARVEVTGYPTRTSLVKWERNQAVAHFGLRSDMPILLVFGGSKGARSINRAVISAAGEILSATQIIHISGTLDWDEVQTALSSLPAALQGRYRGVPYLHEDMGAALTCADLIVSRAGASTLGELPLFGIPAILIPYPYAWRYQKVNADYLANQHAAVILEDAKVKDDLATLVKNLISDTNRLGAMRQAMQALSRPSAAQRLADLVRELAGENGGER